MVENTPDEIGLNFSLSTRQAIQNFITKTWNVSVSLVTVGRYMKKLGFKEIEVVSISVARGRNAGRYTLMEGLNPIYIVTGKK